MNNIQDAQKRAARKPHILTGPERKPVTLIVGLQCKNAVVVAAEMEEAAGITAKRQIYKLRRISGRDWTVVVGGAGSAAVIENVTRRLEQRLADYETKMLTEQRLMSAIDELLEYAYDRYIDPVPSSEGIALVVGVSSGDQQYLIRTEKRTPYVEPNFACAGIGVDLGVYFLDRLHYPDDFSWRDGAHVASFVLKEAKEAAQNCGIGSEAYVLQSPPRPRWLWMGEDVMNEIEQRKPWWEEVLRDFLSDMLKENFSPATFGVDYSEEPIQDSSILGLSRQAAQAAQKLGPFLRRRLYPNGSRLHEMPFGSRRPTVIREILPACPEELTSSASSEAESQPAPAARNKHST